MVVVDMQPGLCVSRFAAVFAAFVAGIAAIIGIDFGAKFVAALGVAFEVRY